MSVKTKRFICALLAFLMLTASACGNTETTEAPKDSDPATETESSDVSDLDPEKERNVNITVNGAVDSMEFFELPLGQVAAAGWLKNQLLLQAEEVTGKFEELSPDCKSEGSDRSGWLGGTGEDWERGTYYVRGLISTAYVLDDAELKEKAQKWIEWTLESQTEKGTFGPFANDVGTLDYWPLMPMLMALELYCDATGDERVVPFLESYFAWQAEALKTKPLSSWAKSRAGDNIFAVLWLYERTGDESLISLCETLYSQSFDWEAAYDTEAFTESYHIVNLHQSFKLFPTMYAVTGDTRYLDIYYKGIENLYMASGRQDGMSNGDELSRGIDAVFGSETCAVVERMLSDEIALTLLRDATIADHLELITYNAFPQQLLPDGKGQVYFTMQNQVLANLGAHGFSSDGGDRLVYGFPGGFPCCVHNYQMGWPLFVASMWMGTSDKGLAVGAYGPNTVTATVGEGTVLTITESTVYPYEDTVTLTLNADKTDTYPLYLRVPEWCAAPSVKVNGYPIEAELKAGEYFKLSSEWQDGDVITLNFPSEIEATLTDNNSVSIKKGAVLFALEIGEEWKRIKYDSNNWGLVRDYPAYNITPSTDWNYALLDFDFADIASNFKVTYNGVEDSMRFKLSDVPIVLEAEAKLVTDWELDKKNEIASDTPVSPVAAERLGDETVTVRLVPFSHTRLRVTCMPWTGSLPAASALRPDESTILFDSVIVPMEQASGSQGTLLLSYLMNIKYDADEDTEVSVEINRKPAGTVTLKKGGGEIELVTELLRTDYHNRVSFVSDGSLLGVSVSISAEVAGVTAARYEAEDAKLTGSAYKAPTHVAGIDDVGSSLTFSAVDIVKDGDYAMRIYYAAPMGKATHTVYVDGKKAAVAVYNDNGKTLGWGSFDESIYEELTLTLTKGRHEIMIIKSGSDTGFAELDAFDLIPCTP